MSQAELQIELTAARESVDRQSSILEALLARHQEDPDHGSRQLDHHICEVETTLIQEMAKYQKVRHACEKR